MSASAGCATTVEHVQYSSALGGGEQRKKTMGIASTHRVGGMYEKNTYVRISVFNTNAALIETR